MEQAKRCLTDGLGLVVGAKEENAQKITSFLQSLAMIDADAIMIDFCDQNTVRWPLGLRMDHLHRADHYFNKGTNESLQIYARIMGAAVGEVPREPVHSSSLSMLGLFSAQPNYYAVGEAVSIVGLSGRQDLNGREGRVLGCNQEKERYAVEIIGLQEKVLIKPSNLVKSLPSSTDQFSNAFTGGTALSP